VLGFVIPVKSPRVATSWIEVCKLFERCLRSVCNQKTPNFRVVVVCNEIPSVQFKHNNVNFLQADLEIPENDYASKIRDREKKVVIGLMYLKRYNPSHVMCVDADDCISNRIARYVEDFGTGNGWFIDSGYEYEEGANFVICRKSGFFRICGTCNIINYKLLHLPHESDKYANITDKDYDRFIGGHGLARADLENRGTPLEPLPFPGAIYIRDKIGESVTMQEPALEKFMRNPRENFRHVKKMMSFLNRQVITEDIRDEFGLYPLDCMYE
jgi:hypothetical protein